MAQKNFLELSTEELHAAVKDFMLTQVSIFCRHNKCEAAEALRLTDDLGLTNLDLAMLFYDIESEFKISLPDDKAEKAETVKDFINLIIDQLTPMAANT